LKGREFSAEPKKVLRVYWVNEKKQKKTKKQRPYADWGGALDYRLLPVGGILVNSKITQSRTKGGLGRSNRGPGLGTTTGGKINR